jgi:hypothetical protein
VLSRQLDDLEPTLTRHGYRIKDLVEQFDARPSEIKGLFSSMLNPARAAELRDKMLAAELLRFNVDKVLRRSGSRAKRRISTALYPLDRAALLQDKILLRCGTRG